MLTPPQRNQSALEIYVAQPDADKEALSGKLFALMEIESNKAAGLKIINFLINTLNHNYYQNEKMILRERVNAIKVEHIFESALAKTNKKLAEFLRAEKITLNPDILNLTVGVVCNDSLHFANLGKNKTLLVYKSKSEAGAKYKMADITEQTGAAEAKKKSSAIKLFSNIISGALPRGGYFIFANETFGEYLSAKQIINITTTLPPAGAAEQIKNTLSQINAYVPFLGIIIKNTAGLEMSKINIKEPTASTKVSIENLVVTEEKTEKLLTPSGLINAKKWSLSLNNFFNRFAFNRAGKNANSAFLLKDRIFTKKKTVWLSAKKIFGRLRSAAVYLTGLCIYSLKIITDKKALMEFWRNLIIGTKNCLQAAKTLGLKTFFWYRNLGRINKILFSVFSLCLLIFFASLGWQNVKNKTAEKETALTNLTAAVKQKQNQIDASLLYDNETGAKKLLEEVKDLMARLPQKTQSQKDQYNELTAKSQVQAEKISRVIRVNPIELANFLNFNQAAKPKNIILASNKIYAADTSQSAIYIIDLGNKLVTSANLNNQKLSQLDFPSLDKNNNVYYLDSSSLAVLDTKSVKLSSLGIDYGGNFEKAIDLKQYNSRFYLADKTAGQIYRFTKGSVGLTNPIAWFSNKEDLSDVVGLDIDGDIYLLKNSGEVLRYAKGKKEDFTLAAIEPAISQASKIAVSAEENFIYVFEPAVKRLAVFNKDGKFNCQYTSDKLNDLKDFQIDEKNKKIYFLDNAAVYSIEMSHLVK